MPGLDKMREAKSGEQPTAAAQSDGFATAADFMQGFRTSTYTLSNGMTVEFRALLPIDFQSFRGSALNARMTEAGLNYNKAETRIEFVDEMPFAAQTEIVIEAAKQTIIQAVISVQFTAMPPAQCPPNKVSVDVLPPTDVLNLSAAIQKFSGGDEAEEIFRDASEADAEDTAGADADSEGEHADDSTDSEGVQSESV